jgi:hypothetical protein
MMTHGGLPESEALHWNDETRQQIGQVVFMLVAGSKDKSKQGYIKFYQLKRKFMADEFDGFILRLDAHRKEKGFTTLSDMVAAVGRKLIASGDTVDFDEQPTGPVEPEAVRRYEIITPPLPVIHHEAEQMSLF